jgi:hypothetical protein
MKYKLLIAPLIFSTGSIVALLIINHDISLRYLSSDGKTRALFGLIEIQFSYKYYFLVFAISSFILAALAIRKKEIRWIATVAIVLSFSSIVLVFIRLWKFMV